MSIFGPIKDADQVEAAVEDTIKYWIDTFLREKEDQDGIPANSFPLPRAYVRAVEPDKFPEDQLPAVILHCPGLKDRPYAEGDGTYNAPFEVNVFVETMASSPAQTRWLAKKYTAVVRDILIKKASLRGFAEGGTVWDDESYDDLAIEDERTIGYGQVSFTVWVQDVSTRFGGPLEPADPVEQPGSEWPLVLTHEETITEIPVDEEVN